MTRLVFYLNIYLLFVGLAISSYLLYVYTSNSALPCTISHGCDTVRYSQYAKLFSVPVPFFGVLFYICGLGLAGLGLVQKRLRYLLLLWVLTAWGFVFAGYLTYLEAYVINAWCSWCVINAGVNVLTFLMTTYVIVVTVKRRSLPGILFS